MKTQDLAHELRGEMDEVRVIDTHEHIRKVEDLRRDGQNLFTSLKHTLVNFDLVAAGIGPGPWASYSGGYSVDPEITWRQVEPHLDKVKNTSFYRTMIWAYQDLFGFEANDITASNWRDLSDRIHQAYERDDWYDMVIRRRLNVEVAFLDNFIYPGWLAVDRRFFLPVQRFEYFYFVHSTKFLKTLTISPVRVQDIASGWGLDPSGFNDLEAYEHMLDEAFGRILAAGCPCIKLAGAYSRDLYFEKVPRDRAATLFATSEADLTAEEARALEGYILHQIIERAAANTLPIQIHTGVQGGIASIIRNADPLALNNLFFDYPDAKFILFHMGFPYSREVALLAKTFPNVYVDVCWMTWYVYDTFKRMFREWIELVPNNKIMAGGDTEVVERMYSALTATKSLLAEVFAEAIGAGSLPRDIASLMSRRILRENALEVFPRLKPLLEERKVGAM